MDLARKIEILENADFSAWRRDYLPPTSQAQIGYGFGNVRINLLSTITNIADIGNKVDGRILEPDIAICRMGYKLLQSYYATIPFAEMDPRDKDFSFLFEYKSKLDALGPSFEVFVDRYHREGSAVARDWPEYKRFLTLFESMSSMNYRRDVLRKHGLE